MSMMPTRFRIEPDPQTPGRWRFIDLEIGQAVGGFRDAKAARRAYEREKKEMGR